MSVSLTLVRPKICFFPWEAVWGKILTLDRLKKRAFAFANRSYLCHECKETMDHLLILCKKMRLLWELLFSLFRISWVSRDTVWDSLISWDNCWVRKKWRKMWQAVPPCLFWSLWKARNGVALRDEIFSTLRLKISFVSLLWVET